MKVTDILWDYMKHFYFAILLITASLAFYSYFVLGYSVIQLFEDHYEYQVTAHNLTLSDDYWNMDSKTMVTPDGTLTLKHGETTDGFVFLDEAGKTRNLMLIFEFTPSKDTIRPYDILRENFILYQGGVELSDGGITNENDSREYQTAMNQAVSFYNEGQTMVGARSIAYQPNGGPVTIVINGTEYPLTDIIPVYEQSVAHQLRASGDLVSLTGSVLDEEKENGEVEEETEERENDEE